MRHCKPRSRNSRYTQEFQQHFNETYAPKIIDLAFQFVSNYDNFYIPPKLVATALRTLKMGIKNSLTGKSMSNHFNRILFDYCLPMLRFNSRDVEYWEEEK